MDNAIEQLLSKQEIYELSCRYMRGLDRHDPELLKSVFFEDGWCEYGFFNASPADFIDFAMEALASHIANQHVIGNVLIEFEGEEAFGEVYFNAYHKVRNESGEFEDVFIAGRYLDRYERREGVWKMAYRSEIVDWSRTSPSNDPYFEAAPGCRRGGRQDDPVFRHKDRRQPST